MNQYEKLTIAARYYLLGKGMLLAADAMEQGRKIHNGYRKDGVTPEFQHQLQIFHYLRTLEQALMYPEDTYIAAFLHDSTEDYPHVTKQFILSRNYSERAADAIFLLDKNGRTMEGYMHNLKQCPVASIVKCADRAHNMSTMTSVFTPEKQQRYMTEVETLFMPMIKECRRAFPMQENAYENVKHVLNIQLDMLEVINKKETE